MCTREILERVLTLEEREYCFGIIIENEALFLLEIDDSKLRDYFYKVQELVKERFGVYDFLMFKVDLMDTLARTYMEGK